MLGEAGQHLGGAVAEPRLAAGHLVALALQVAQAELDRIGADGERELLHVRVDREDRLRRDRGAVGGDARLVREHLESLDVEVRPQVEARQEDAATASTAPENAPDSRMASASSAHERAVALDAGLQLDDDLRRRHAGLQLLAAGHDVAHRPAGGARQDRGDRLAERADLAAEAAAALHRDHLDAVLGDLQHVGHFGARVERALRARPERQVAGAVPLGQHRVRLE